MDEKLKEIGGQRKLLFVDSEAHYAIKAAAKAAGKTTLRFVSDWARTLKVKA